MKNRQRGRASVPSAPQKVLTRDDLGRVRGGHEVGVIERDGQLVASSYADWPTLLP